MVRWATSITVVLACTCVTGCLRSTRSSTYEEKNEPSFIDDQAETKAEEKEPESENTNETSDEENRQKRSAARYEPGSKKLWSSTVNYDIDSSLPANLKKLVKEAIKYLEDHTCIKFKKSKDGDYISFTKTKGVCSSTIGRSGGKQDLFMNGGAEGCESLALTLHEIMHALGLDHEMKRSDRSKYINVNTKSLKNPGQFKIDKKLYEDGPYDLASVMQYDNKYLSKGSPTFTVKQKASQFYVERTVKTYSKPSFYDLEMLNDLYGCIDKCGDKECKNEGYKSGKGCKCICPKGLGGKKCGKRDAKCGKTLSGDYGTIESETFAKKLMSTKKLDKECSWLVPASHEQVVHLSFYDHVHAPITDEYTNYIEVRGNAITLPGLRFSGAADHTKMAYAIPGPAFIELGLKNTNGFGVGFKATYTVLPLETYMKCNPKVCYNGGKLKPDCTCQCRKGYKGKDCEEFQNKECDKRTLPCRNRGILDINSDDCACKCPKDDSAAVAIMGDQCQYFGYCHHRMDPAVVNAVAPQATEDDAICSSVSKCDGSLDLHLRCPKKCNAPCQCINFMELKKPGVCAAQKAQCNGDAKKKQFMEILCQQTCGACPK